MLDHVRLFLVAQLTPGQKVNRHVWVYAAVPAGHAPESNSLLVKRQWLYCDLVHRYGVSTIVPVLLMVMLPVIRLSTSIVAGSILWINPVATSAAAPVSG